MAGHHFFLIPPEGKPLQFKTLDEALASDRRHGYLWLDFFEPAKEELYALEDSLGLHPLTVEDCLDEQQVPKLEDYPTNTVIIFNSYGYEKKELSIHELDLVTGKTFLVSVHHNATDREAMHLAMEKSLELNGGGVRRGPDYLLHGILDFTVDRKFTAIEALQDEIDEAEEKILEDYGNFKPESLMYLRRHLLSLRKSLVHEREILLKICRRDSPFISEKAIYHFRDVYDHLAKFFEAIEIYREMIGSLMEMYISLVNNRLALMANRTNRVMRRLTLIATIFMPLSFLAGVGGMSEWSMFWGPESWKFSYPLFFLIMGLIALGNYYLLKRVDRREERQLSDICIVHQGSPKA